MITAVQSEKLLQELERVWEEMGRGQKEAAVLRACSMTLIVATLQQGDVEEVSATLGDLMRTHPGRMIVLRILEGQEPVLEANVNAQCQLSFGNRQQICCEMIEIRATRDRIPDVYAAALGMAAADLPVILWMKDIRLLDEPSFVPMLQLARTMIVDSVPQGLNGLRKLERLRLDGWRVKDLAWTRCTAWRETLAQAFETQCLQGVVPEIQTVEIVYAGEEPSVSGLYLKAWLEERVPQATIYFVPGEARRKGNLQALLFLSPGRTLTLRAVDDSALEVTAGSLTTRVLAPARSEADLLAEELSILGDDPVYEATLAATIAQ